jgi:2-keto-4-pentenoate hydratase/2-oxohepta-3-ene-1,7-dioic acid hydratase in catechol pathway
VCWSRCSTSPLPRADEWADGNAYINHVELVRRARDAELPESLAKGFGSFQSKPAFAFSPVAVTPDELGGAWREGRVDLRLRIDLNGRLDLGGNRPDGGRSAATASARMHGIAMCELPAGERTRPAEPCGRAE